MSGPTPTRRARLVPVDYLPPGEELDDAFPMVLSTGRMLEHWHTGAMTRRAAALDAIEPVATASLHPDDLARLGVAPGALVRLSTRRGSIVLAARADEGIARGTVFVPFAYAEAAANLLTNPALDPHGKIPEFKFCAVRVDPLDATASESE